MATCAPSGTCRSGGSTCSPRSPASAAGPDRSSWPRRCVSALEPQPPPRPPAGGGWVARRDSARPDDLRSIDVVLTGRGRRLWRETSIAYRRAVQRHFAGVLSDDDVHGLLETLERIAPSG